MTHFGDQSIALVEGDELPSALKVVCRSRHMTQCKIHYPVYRTSNIVVIFFKTIQIFFIKTFTQHLLFKLFPKDMKRNK